MREEECLCKEGKKIEYDPQIVSKLKVVEEPLNQTRIQYIFQWCKKQNKVVLYSQSGVLGLIKERLHSF